MYKLGKVRGCDPAEPHQVAIAWVRFAFPLLHAQRPDPGAIPKEATGGAGRALRVGPVRAEDIGGPKDFRHEPLGDGVQLPEGQVEAIDMGGMGIKPGNTQLESPRRA